MSLLSYNRLVQLVEQGVITNVKPEQINAASIDLTLGRYVMREKERHGAGIIDYKLREHLATREIDLQSEEEGDTFILFPGQFALAQSQQVFNLPNNISAEYKLKSSMARIGLEHLNAGWCDAGWHGSVLTLEFKNMTQSHGIRLKYGDAVGQIVFFEHEPVPADRSYAARGRYNNDTSVTGVKP